MKLKFSLGRINQKSPCLVELRNNYSFCFRTPQEGEYSIGFVNDYTLTDDETVFQFFITAIKPNVVPGDTFVQQAVTAVLEEFFLNEGASLVYICDTSDGRQSFRDRLFRIWFSRYPYKGLYCLNSKEICVDGVSYYMSLLSRNDNPNLTELKGSLFIMAQLIQNPK